MPETDIKNPALLAFEDGTIYRGWGFGADTESAGEIVYARNLRARWTCDQKLFGTLAIGRSYEVRDLLALGRDGEIAGGDIAQTFCEVREDLVACRDDEKDREWPLAELLRIFPVQVLLEIARKLGGDPAFATLVHEIQRSAVRHQEADEAPFEHAIEIAGPRLVGAQQVFPSTILACN